MDTNNRQNWSTQNFEAQDVSHYSRDNRRYTSRREQQATMPDGASRGKHAQRETLNQNVAFGTEKKPEGFVQTWKNASHVWRWRAVLCLFLSLLLMLMQPSGNALYRSWNASSGEMMGLAAAAGEDDADGYVPADIEDAPMIAMNGETENGEEVDNSHITPDGRVFFVGDHTLSDVPVLTWTPALEESSGTTTTDNVPYKYINPETLHTSDRSYADFGLEDHRTSSDPAKAADPSKGNMGAITWVGNLKDSQQLAWDADMKPGYWAWSLGYVLFKWRGVMPDNMWSLKPAGYEGVTYNTREDLEKVSVVESYIPIDPYVTTTDIYSGETHAGQTLGELVDPHVDEEDSTKGLYDYYLFAIWHKRTDYKLSILGATKDFGAKLAGNADYVDSLSWDSPVNISSLLASSDIEPALATYLMTNCSWTVSPIFEDTDEQGGKGIAARPGTTSISNAALSSSQTTFGDLVNPDLQSDASVDPFSKSSPYDDDGDEYLGWVSISPSYALIYDAMGGEGGSSTYYPASFSYDKESDSCTVWADPSEDDQVLKSAADLSLSKKNATFLGWHTTTPTTGLTEESVDISNTYISGGAHTLWQALSQVRGWRIEVAESEDDLGYLYDPSGNMVMDSAGSIYRNITLYAVWEESDSYEYNVSNASSTDVDVVLGDPDHTVVGSNPVSIEYAGATGATFNSVLASDELTNATFAKASGLDQAVFDAKYRTTGFSGENPAYTGTPAQIKWDVTDGSDQPVTGDGLAGALPAEGATFTATVEPAKYDITINAIQGTFDNGVTSVVVKNVPYGKNYSEITFDLNAGTTSGSTLTVDYDSTASDTIDDLAADGAGKGKYFYDSKNSAYVENTSSNAWPGAWSPASGSVGGNDVLEYTYDEGYYKLTYQLAETPFGATNGQTTSDAKLSENGGLGKSFYIRASEWDADHILGKAESSVGAGDGITGAVAPVELLKSDGTAIGDSHAKYTGSLIWPSAEDLSKDANFKDKASATPADYTITAQAELKGYDVTLTVGNSIGATGDGGLVTLKADGSATDDQTSNSNVIGKVLYGNLGTEATTGINATVIGGIDPVWDAGYVVAGYTWDGNDPSTTAITENKTFVMKLAGHPYDLEVTIDGGTLNSESSFTITGVPYGTTLSGVHYDSNHKYIKSGGSALDGTLTADTAHGRNANGAWDPTLTTTMPASNSEASYSFGRDPVTVKFVIADGGTWDGTNDTITGTVEYGKTLADLQGATIPNVYNISVNKKAQYATPASAEATTHGTWSAVTPDSTTTVAPTSKTDGAWVQTYTYTLATKDGYTITYKIPDSYKDEVQFATGATNDGKQTDPGTAYGASLSAPTAIAAKSGYTHFNEKYNATITAWTPSLDSIVGGWNANDTTEPTMTKEYVATISLKNYHVTYSIVNGKWANNAATYTDAADYHYGDKPATADYSAVGSTGKWVDTSSTVQPDATYKKTLGSAAGEWSGVWKMKVGSGGWTDLPTGATKPADVEITADTEFQLTLTRVVSVTFNSDSTSISSGGPSVEATEYYAGSNLSVPSVDDETVTPINSDSVTYTKSSGDDKQRGYWDPALPSDGKVPDSATALTYTYKLYPVHTATYNVKHGYWTGGGSADTATRTEEVFENEALSFPDSTVSKSDVYEANETWYVGDETGTTTGTSNITIAADTSYLAYHAPKSGVKLHYTIKFWRQKTDMSTGIENYENYATVTTDNNVVPGTTITLNWLDQIINEQNLPAATKADMTAGAFTADTANSDVGSSKSKIIEDSEQVFNVYYSRNQFNLNYAYSYPDNDSTNSAYDGMPTLPNNGAVMQVPYGATLTPDSAAPDFAATKDFLTFSGWKAEGANPPATMPAAATTLTGTWTRKAATVKAVNTHTTAGTANNGTISANGYTNDNIVLTGLKYGDTITWPEITKTPATGDTFFGGWEYPAGTNIGDTLPATVDSLNMEVNATWSTGIKIMYKHDDAGVGTFTEFESDYKKPEATGDHAGMVQIDAFAGGIDTDESNKPNAGKPSAQKGYVFQGWTWTEGATPYTSTDVENPKSGWTRIPLTFKATYLGTEHIISSYSTNGGTQVANLPNAIRPEYQNPIRRTGGTIYLPNGATELTRPGCTLAGYEITVGGTTLPDLVAPGTSWTVPAGTSEDYTDPIQIKAKWTVKVEFAMQAPTAAGLSATDVPAAIAAANAANAVVALGADVQIPTVNIADSGEADNNVTIANIPVDVWPNDLAKYVNTGYHFSGYTVNDGLSPALSLSKESTQFQIPAATDATFPADNKIVVTANWAIDEYNVHWDYDTTNHNTHSDYDFTSEDPTKINFGTTGAAAQSGTAPTLKAGGTASSLNTAKYTEGANGIDWYLVAPYGGDATARQTKVNLKDITFGTPFWITDDGEYSSTDLGDGRKFTWDSGTAQEVHFVGIPKITPYTIVIQVTNGTMTNPDTGASGLTSVSYTAPYGTPYIASTGGLLPSSASNYTFASGTGDNIKYDPNKGDWAGINPFEGGLTVTGSATYTYAFTTLKTYKVVYQLNDTESDNLALSATPATDDVFSYGAHYAFPTLTAGSMDSAAFTAKYYTDLDWTLKDVAVDTTGTFTDDSADGQTSGTYAKTVTFVGTPKKKSYTVRVAVSGGTFDDGTTAATRTESTSAVYGKKLQDYLPNPNDASDAKKGFTGANAPTVTSGHWEYNGNKVDPADDTVQYTDATYTYVFDTMRTVNMRTVHGDFDDGTSPKTYYIADDLKDATDATLLSAVNAGGSKAFTDAAALAAAYKLKKESPTSGYEWNATGWTTDKTGTYLAPLAQEPDESLLSEGTRQYPKADAIIGADVTYTYEFAAKPVSVNFILMFEKSSSDDYTNADNYEMIAAGATTATTNVADARTALWTGTYDDATTAALSSWSGRILSDATLKGYVVTPWQATTDAAGANATTSIPQTDIADPTTTTYYLWYKRIPITYNYIYTNPSERPAGTSAQLPASGTTIYGKTPAVTLANPTDATFAKALDGWYLKAESPLINVPVDVVAALNAPYDFKPEYEGAPDSLTLTLQGTWGDASYPVKYALESTDDPNDQGAKFTLDSGEPAATVTTNAVQYGYTLGEGNVPTVTVSNDQKYQLDGWKLYVAGTDKTSTLTVSTDGVAPGDNGLLATADLKNLKVMRSEYELRPQFSLQVKTVFLSGGGHADIPETVYRPGDEAAGMYTKWVVPYGTEISLPTFGYSTDQNWLDENDKVVPYDEDKYAVFGTNKASAPAAWVKKGSSSGETWPQDNNGKLTVTENAEYEYQWTEITYDIVYKTKSGDTASNIHDLMGVTVTSGVKWSHSVFSGTFPGSSPDTSVLNYYGKYASGADAGTYIVTKPTWAGHTFLGWRAGSVEKPGGGVLVPAGSDITVSAAYNEAYSGGGNHTVYLWAEWEGKDTTVTFYKNDGVTPEVTATQNMKVAEEGALKRVFELANFEREGYTFDKWYDNRDTAAQGVTSYDDGDSYTPAYDVENDSDLPHNLYATWTANTYKVQYAHFNGDLFTNAEVTGDANEDTKDLPYQQPFVWNADPAPLTSDITADKVNSKGSGGVDLNPDDASFAGWKYNTTTYQPGDNVQNLTPAKNGVITMTPASTGKVALTYDANGEGDTVGHVPTGDNVTVRSNKDQTVNGTPGYAKFTMPSDTPTRAGYTFGGWKIDGAVDASGNPIAAAAENAVVYLPGTVSAYTAVAQWEASKTAKYYIKRMVQNGLNSSTYVPYNNESPIEKNDGTTGQRMTLTQAQIDSYAIPGYTFLPGESTTSIEIKGDETQNIFILKYNLKSLSVNYQFTDATGGLPGVALSGTAAGATPFGADSTEAILGNSTYSLKTFSSDNLPKGYEIYKSDTIDYAGKWAYDKVQSGNALLASGVPVNTGALAAGSQYTVVNDATLTLPLVRKKYDVTFALGANTAWGDGSGDNTKQESDVPYGMSPDMIAYSVIPNGEPGKTYGFGGWIYQNLDDPDDPKNGTIVDPATTDIVGNTKYTAYYFESYAVTWSAGGHSASGFSHTPLARLQLQKLVTTDGEYMWVSDDPADYTANKVGGLILNAADVDENGVPLAEAGYRFDGWKVGDKVYASLDELYAALPPSADYLIEAQWDTITQTVVFNPNVTDGAVAGSPTVTMTGKSRAEKTLTPTDGADAKAPAAPEARPGYTFLYWENQDDPTIQLAAEQQFTFPAKAAPATTTYLAKWEADTIDILSAIDGSGSITANKPTTHIVANDPSLPDGYTLKANPQPGYKFDKWTVTPTDPSVDPWDISTWYSTTITDKSNSEYGLLTLKQNNDGLYEAATYTAHFKADPYQVKFVNSDGDKGTISVTYAPIDGNPVDYELVGSLGNVSTTTFSATGIEPGYSFAGWTYEMYKETADENGVVSTATTPTTGGPLSEADVRALRIQGNTVFTAQYSPKEATVTYDKNEPSGVTISGSVGQETGKTTGYELTLPSGGFTWPGHTLIGWVTAGPGTAAPTQSTMTKAELAAYPYLVGFADPADGSNKYTLKGGNETLYAIYEAVPVTLKYDNNAQGAAIDAGIALAGSADKIVYAGEEATALTVDEVNWSSDPLVTQPGFVTDDAVPLKIPGAAREFAGWSFDPNADPNDPDHSAVIFAAGSKIPASYLPSGEGGDTTKTIYAIWKNKKFNVYLEPNGGWKKEGATLPASPLATDVEYGQIVPIPENPYTRGDAYYFRYWLANDDATRPSRVSNATGAAASYTFKGTSDVTLTAQWQATATAKPVAMVQLMDEGDRALTTSPMGGYLENDKPLASGTYENLTSLGSGVTKDTSAYFNFEGWYIYNTRTDSADSAQTQKVVQGRDAIIANIVAMYDGRVDSLPVYWDKNAGTYDSATFPGANYQNNVLTLYAKKTLKAYDIKFNANIPSGSGYSTTDAGTLDPMTGLKIEGETRQLTTVPDTLPGYKFLGWEMRESASNATTTQSAFDTAKSNKKALTVPYDLSTPLLDASSKDYEVTLYAAWADTLSTVSFVSAYEGDGVRTAGGETVISDATKTNKKWKDALGDAPTLAKHPDDVDTTSTTALIGWKTENGVTIWPTDPAKNFADLTVADIVAADPALTPDTATGAYDIKLYAIWSHTAARVKYHNDDPDATGDLPADRAIQINEAATALPANTYTPETVDLKKVGYHADGWEGKGNTGMYNGVENAYNKVFYMEPASGFVVNFDKHAAGMEVNLYPHFSPNEYVVTYEYGAPNDDYASLVTPVPIKGKKDAADVESVKVGWTTGSVYARDLFDTEPVLEGYTLTGWAYTTPKGNTINVEKGWTVEQLIAAAIAADGETDQLNSMKYANGQIALEAVWTPKTYTVAYDARGGVLIATGAAPGAKTGIKWTDKVDAAGDRLLIEASKMRRDGYSDPEWYVDDANTTKANSKSGDKPTLQDLVYLYHQAKGETTANAGNVFSGTLTLYADWTEDLVTITFAVSDGEYGWITKAGKAGSETPYAANAKTEISYEVGAITGEVKKVDGVEVPAGTNISEVQVTVDKATGYQVSGWVFEDTENVAGADVMTFGITKYNGTSSYVGGTYEAQIEGQPNVPITVVYHDQVVDASNNVTYTTTTVTTIDGEPLTSAHFLNSEGGKAKVGDVIPADRLGAIRTNVPAGLKLNTAKLADYTVKEADNQIDLWYDIAKVDVKFAWQWPDGSECATPPTTPATRLSQPYGSMQTVPGAYEAEGYEFDGWYLDGAKLTTGGEFTLQSTEDITLYGKFTKKSYTVTLQGVYDEDRNALSGAGVPTSSTAITEPVAKGEMLGEKLRIVITDSANKVQEVKLGKQTGTVDFSVTYNSDEYAITWMYEAGGEWRTTSDPTKVEINQNTTFFVIASGAQMISYLTGDHGAFDTTKAAGTRVENVPAGYNMADYLYLSRNDLKQAAGPVETNTVSDNYGMPTGDPGWRFAGWKWEYAGANGYMRDGATPDDVVTAETIDPERMMNAGVEDLTGLVHGIQLTAQWVPASSYLKFDLGDRGEVPNAVNSRVYADWTSGDPSGLKPTYDGTNAVTLPGVDDVARDGFTLSKWQWTTGGNTYEYEPGASFQMPSSDKTTASDPAVTLTAVWVEDYVTLEYVSNDNAKGTVSASETVGAWNGTARGTGAALAGSEAVPAAHFNFVKWSKGDFDGAALTEAEGVDASTNSLMPKRNNAGRYVATKYCATFVGDTVEVTFVVADGQSSMGDIRIDGFNKDEAETLQNVPYNDAPDMSKTKAVPKEGYTLGDNRYWDIYTSNDGGTTWTKKGTTDDPAKVKVKTKTRFAANFKKNTGSYVVNFDSNGSSDEFDSIKKGWGDTNVGAGKNPTRLGYEFTGWWADPRGQSPATVASKGGKANYDAAPGLLPAVSSTYSQLAGGDAYEPQAKADGITLKAGWREKSGYAVVFSSNGGTFDKDDPTDVSRTVTDLSWTNKVTGRVPDPVRPGHKFIGWAPKSSGDPIADGTTYAEIAGSNDTAPGGVTLYAQWEELTYKVKYVNTLTGGDPITAPPESADAILRDDVKYTEIIAIGQPYNSKPDERVWHCWKVATNNGTTPDQELTEEAGAADWTIADFEKHNVSMDDGYYVVYADWTNYIEYTTQYILFESVPPAGEDLASYMGEDFENPKAKQGTTVTDKGLPGEDARPNMVAKIPPGFALDEDLTLRYNNEELNHQPPFTSTDEIKVTLSENAVPPTFYVAVVAKTGYSLAFDVNDKNIEFPGGITHKAVPGTDDGSAYPTQTVKDFYKRHNVPWTPYDVDNTDIGEALGDPTRPGFTFDGWYNLQFKDNQELDESIAIKSNETILFGDLAFNDKGEWYDPMDPPSYGTLTLYARWNELQRIVHYIVAEDMKSLVKIRLQSEADSAYSVAERSEIIGAATGDVFENGVRKAHDEVPQGAIAKVNRGYTVVWRILLADAAAQAKSYSMPLGAYGDNATTMSASSVVSDMSAMAAAAIDEATGAEAEASAEGAPMSAMGTVGGSDKATSSQGKTYSATAAITPGVAADTGLFAGEATSADDTDASKVLYVATASQNASKNITFNPSGADKYSGPSKLSQPYGTFIGETPENGVWGVSDGSLPDRNQIRRVGHTFNGWKSSTALTYEGEDGSIQEIPANTVIVPGSWIANHLIVPESGVTLTADWKEGAPTWAIVIPDSTNPNTGEVVPGTTIEVKDGETPTNDQISEILNRGGSYPDKWSVTYYDIDGKQHSETMTTDQLIAFLQKNPVVSDMTIAPAQGAKWGTTAPTIPDNGSGTKGASAKAKSAKTGDSLMTMVPTLAGIAFAAAAVLFLLLSFRRRRD